MHPDSSEAVQARARLNAEREHLAASLKDLDQEISEDGAISLSGDAAADTTAADARHGLRAGLESQIAEVDAALQRVDDGTYGVDEVTGEPIDPARLEALPAARTNVGS